MLCNLMSNLLILETKGAACAACIPTMNIVGLLGENGLLCGNVQEPCHE